MRPRALRTVLVGLLLAAGYCAPAYGREMSLGFFDPVFSSADANERSQWLTRARSDGSGIVRITVTWSSIAPREPASPSEPQDPSYRWRALDAAIADALRHGQRVLLTFGDAPAWAQGSDDAGRSTYPGAWKPDAAALGAFATATGRRYGDDVKHWQTWNEPNLPKYLAPQYERRNGRWVAFAPSRYRAMQNAVYRAIKSSVPGSNVITAGTAPYGDLTRKPSSRIMPVEFWRLLLRRPTYFDAFAHHPYGVRGPFSSALNTDDAAIPDIRRISRVVDRARARGTARPRTRKASWVTEISWDSSPPDPYGVPARQHARWLQEALFVLWQQRVRTVLWFRVRDDARGRGWGYTNQSGIYLFEGKPKLAQQAYTFPLVARRLRSGRVRLWGIAPSSGTVRIDERRAGRWRRAARLRTSGNRRVFTRTLAVGRRATNFRASSGGQRSLTYRAGPSG